jgi:UDP-N-acetylmuramoyl-L-alanyl-D-glutamate--2,6-diaminopimelate ligase
MPHRSSEVERLEWPSEAELSALDRLEAAATAKALATSAVRPTPQPFSWAEPLLTLGVTGTNGKSSTAHLAAAAVRAAGHSVLLESTLGYYLDERELAVPRTSRGYAAAMKHSVERGARHAVIEVTSAALARGFARIWRYDIGVFTNLSRDHVSQHGSWEHYLASKAQLFVHLAPGRTAVLNACDPAALLIDRVTPGDVERRWFAVASRGEALHRADLAARSVSLNRAGTRIELEPSPFAEALGGALEIRLIGAVFAENALAACLGVLATGVAPEAVRRGLAACPVVPGRFEIVSGEPLVAIDYAHTPDALARTGDTARALAGTGRVIVVFGAGGGRDATKRDAMGRAIGERAELAIVTSDNPRNEDPRVIARAVARGCRRGGRAHVRIEIDRRTAIARALEAARRDDVVVIAGKGHEKGQEIAGVVHPFSDRDEVLALLGAVPDASDAR